jgi:hypothetical protein
VKKAPKQDPLRLEDTDGKSMKIYENHVKIFENQWKSGGGDDGGVL